MPALLASLPILAVLVLMLGAGWSAARAGTVAAAGTLVLAVIAFGFGDACKPNGSNCGDSYGAPAGVAGVLAEAGFVALTVVAIIGPALDIHYLQQRTGATDRLRGLARITPDPRVAALLIAWFFTLFIEGRRRLRYAGAGPDRDHGPDRVGAGLGHRAVIGAVTFVMLVVAVRRRVALPVPAAAAPPPSPPDGPQLSLVRAGAPYLTLVGLVLLTRLVPPVRDALFGVELQWRLFDAFSGNVRPLYHPALLLTAAFLAGALAQRAAPRTAVGALGTFVTGSATASNVLFTEFQQTTAETAGLPVTPLLGAQGFGAAVGNIICPHNIVAAAATVGLSGQEGRVLRLTLPVAIGYVALGGILAWLLVTA